MDDQINQGQYFIAGVVLIFLAIFVFFSYQRRVLVGVESSLNELEKNISSSLNLANEILDESTNGQIKDEVTKLIECLKKTKSDLPSILKDKNRKPRQSNNFSD